MFDRCLSLGLSDAGPSALDDETRKRREKRSVIFFFFGSPETWLSTAIKPLENGITSGNLGRQLHLHESMKVNKIDRPNMTPAVRGICTIAVYFLVFRPRFVASLLFMKGISYCYKEKTGVRRS